MNFSDERVALTIRKLQDIPKAKYILSPLHYLILRLAHKLVGGAAWSTYATDRLRTNGYVVIWDRDYGRYCPPAVSVLVNRDID